VTKRNIDMPTYEMPLLLRIMKKVL